MARKTGLGPQGRRTIDESRASDTASKGAFSEIPGRVESGKTTAPVDTIPGYVTAAERPTPTPAPGGLLGGSLGRGGPGGRLLPNGSRYAGPVNPNEVIPASRNVSTSPTMPGTVSGNTPSASNAGPGRGAPVGNASYGGGGGGSTPVISGTSAPGASASPKGAGWVNKVAPQVDLALKGIKAAFRPSPYAPMTWMERNLSSEGLSMLYGRGPGTAPLYGYETSRYHIQPHKKDPSDNFHSARHDPNVAEEPALRERQGSYQPQDSEIPMFQQGGNSTAAERLHRGNDPLHENATQNLWGTPHEAAMGNLSGDVHTRTTRGFGDTTPSGRVESIRAPKPE
jgi:hypothetical protein